MPVHRTTIRDVAYRVGRDFKAVPWHAMPLVKAGMNRTENGAVGFPSDPVHVGFDIMAT